MENSFDVSGWRRFEIKRKKKRCFYRKISKFLKYRVNIDIQDNEGRTAL